MDMAKMVFKTLFRTIRASLGRYIAILAIVALGVGFFTGLKSAQPSMQATADRYFDAQQMYDFQLVSSLGLTSGDVEALSETEGIQSAEGGYRLEALAHIGEGEDSVWQFLSLPERIALPQLTAGRMPEQEGECLADDSAFSEDDIGKTITVSSENEETTFSQLTRTEYTIVGLAQSPRYISPDRGSASMGSGEIAGFLYLPSGAFQSDVYHEILLRAEEDTVVFSDEYDEMIEGLRPAVETALNDQAQQRYEALRAASAQAGGGEPAQPAVSVLGLDSNAG